MLHPRPLGFVSGLLLVVCLPGMAVGGDAAPASAAGFGPAVDWSLTGRVSLTTEADLNRDLLPDETSDLLSTTRLDAGLSLGAKTKRGLYTADLGLVGRVYLGPNQPNSDDWPVDPRFAASARYTGKRYEFSTNFSFDIQPTSETQFDDTGILSDSDLQLSVRYSAALALEVSRRDRLTFSGSAALVDFIDGGAPGLVANRNVTTGLSWDRTLDARTTLGLDLTFGYFTSDNVVNTRSQTISLAARFSQQRTRRHTISFSLGPTFVRTKERGSGTDFDGGFGGSADFGYKLQDYALGLFLTQDIEPSSAGELQSFTRAGARLSWTVTPRKNLALSTDYTRRTGLSGTGTRASDTFSANASYNYTLTREARLSFGYRFRARNEDIGGFATGHQVFLALTHDFTLLP